MDYPFKIISLYYKRLTMANLNKKNADNNIHLNSEGSENLSIDELYLFIDEWLPRIYSADVNKLLPKDKQLEDTTYIRQVKREKINNPLIINALYRHAQFHKIQLMQTESPELSH